MYADSNFHLIMTYKIQCCLNLNYLYIIKYNIQYAMIINLLSNWNLSISNKNINYDNQYFGISIHEDISIKFVYYELVMYSFF